jgi:hypothetical protein
MRELAIMIQNLLRREEGQDLLEYALAVTSGVGGMEKGADFSRRPFSS